MGWRDWWPWKTGTWECACGAKAWDENKDIKTMMNDFDAHMKTHVSGTAFTITMAYLFWPYRIIEASDGHVEHNLVEGSHEC